MSYNIYCEVNSMLELKEYFSFRKQCKNAKGWNFLDRRVIREIYFGRKDIPDQWENTTGKKYLPLKSEKGIIYQMVREGRSEEIFLNQIRYQKGYYYQNSIRLTKEQCRKILDGDIDWMKDYEDTLLYDFYFHSLHNNVVYLKMTELIREDYLQPEQQYHISMNISRRELTGQKHLFLADSLEGKEMVKENEVQMVLRKEKKIPKSIIEIMEVPQLSESCDSQLRCS